MKSFKDFCSTGDGLPPLWPFAPQWPFDAELKAKVAAKTGLALFGAQMLPYMGRQEEMDRRSYHYYELFDKYKNSSPNARTVREWVELMVVPAGFIADDALSELGASTKMTHDEFFEAMTSLLFSLELSPTYTPPDDTKRVCDACDKRSTSQCMCGAPYCSRECLRKNWANHRSTCKMLFDNNFMGSSWMLNECEMRERLTEAEFCAAVGTSSNPLRKPGATSCVHCHKSDKKKKNKKCAGCGYVHYCSKECQKADWKNHKAFCKKSAADVQDHPNLLFDRP